MNKDRSLVAISWLGLLAWCCPGCCTTRAPVDVTLTAMSFNIRNGRANDGDNRWSNRRPLVAEVIRGYAPDVVGLQEAAKGRAFTALVDSYSKCLKPPQDLKDRLTKDGEEPLRTLTRVQQYAAFVRERDQAKMTAAQAADEERRANMSAMRHLNTAFAPSAPLTG